MAEQITNYQCPACTGPLHYSESLGKLKCDYCGTEYEVAEIEAMYAKRAGILRISTTTGARMQQA